MSVIHLPPSEHLPGGPKPPRMPANIEAEQALLGAMLYDNAAYERLPRPRCRRATSTSPSTRACSRRWRSIIRKGQLAEPIVLIERFRRDPAFEELGGLRYLADLVDRAPPAANARRLRPCHLRPGPAPRPDPHRRRDLAQRLHATRTSPPATRSNGRAAALQPGRDRARPPPASSPSPTPCTAAVEMAAEAYSRDGGLAGRLHRPDRPRPASSAACTPPTW